MLLLARLLVAAARAREESRGTHSRADHPARDDERFRGRLEHRRGAEPGLVPLQGPPR
ncbi:L-aspartate oxidase [compost metagenome]